MASVNPYTVISAVFCFFPGDEFENDRERIHSAFFTIRERHFDLLKDLSFRQNLLFPRSRLLDEIMGSLQPEFLGKNNPGLESYKIKKERLIKLWNDELKSALADKEPEIKKIAEELCQSLRAQ
jgi:hypothetical protein